MTSVPPVSSPVPPDDPIRPIFIPLNHLDRLQLGKGLMKLMKQDPDRGKGIDLLCSIQRQSLSEFEDDPTSFVRLGERIVKEGYGKLLKNLQERINRLKKPWNITELVREEMSRKGVSFDSASAASSGVSEKVLSIAFEEPGFFDGLDASSARRGLPPFMETILESFANISDLNELLDNYEKAKIGIYPRTADSVSDEMDPYARENLLSALRAIIEARIKVAPVESREAAEEKIELFREGASAAQFANALHKAHRYGITGQGVWVGVMESIGPEYEGKEIAGKKRGFDSSHGADKQTNEHGFHVTGIVGQVAPRASIQIFFRDPDSFRADILNCSLVSKDKNNVSIQLVEAFNLYGQRLIVKASGNEGVALDLPEEAPVRNNDQEFLRRLSPKKRSAMILVGNLDNGNVMSKSSNTPGSDPNIYDHFIWTLGSDVLSFTGSEEYGVMSGTSMATPIVSAAAALVKGRFSTLSMVEVKECLLESARRDFLVVRGNIAKRVVAPGKPVDFSKNERPFDRHLWGKGILDVERALEYAHLKTTHPELSSEEIRSILDLRQEAKEKAAARTIQKLFRRRKHS